MSASLGGYQSSSSGTTKPWRGQVPHLLNLYNRAEGVYGAGPQTMYPGTMVAPRDPGAAAGLEGTVQRGLGGSPVTDQAQNLNLATTGGYFLGGPGSNPYLDETYNRGARQFEQQFNRIVMPNIAGRFGMAGRTGSGAEGNALRGAAGELATGLGDLALNTYGGNYQAERDRMMGAAGQAPGLAATDYQDLGAATQAGMERENYAQQLINELVQRHDFAQQEPGNALARFSSLIGQPVMASSNRSNAKSLQGGLGLGG